VRTCIGVGSGPKNGVGAKIKIFFLGKSILSRVRLGGITICDVFMCLNVLSYTLSNRVGSGPKNGVGAKIKIFFLGKSVVLGLRLFIFDI